MLHASLSHTLLPVEPPAKTYGHAIMVGPQGPLTLLPRRMAGACDEVTVIQDKAFEPVVERLSPAWLHNRWVDLSRVGVLPTLVAQQVALSGPVDLVICCLTDKPVGLEGALACVVGRRERPVPFYLVLGPQASIERVGACRRTLSSVPGISLREINLSAEPASLARAGLEHWNSINTALLSAVLADRVKSVISL